VPPSPPIFDDAYGLSAANFGGVRLIAFCGVSGAGKSTAIDYLCRRHRDFRQRPALVVAPADAATTAIPEQCVVVVEELRKPPELRVLGTLLRRGATVLAASHLVPAWFTPFRLWAPTRCYRLDKDWRKIARYLQRRQIVYSEGAVQRYCQRYGANYIDVDVILERCPAPRFDDALARFERFCDVRRCPASAATGVKNR
jgi:hypothetical protein